jgi:hypothetical protein
MDQPNQATASAQPQMTAPPPTLFIGLEFHPTQFLQPPFPNPTSLPPPQRFRRRQDFTVERRDAGIHWATPRTRWHNPVLWLTFVPYHHSTWPQLGFRRQRRNARIPLPPGWAFPWRRIGLGVPWRIGGGGCNISDCGCCEGDYIRRSLHLCQGQLWWW